MSSTGVTPQVSWRQLAPIFADVVVSPSNILIGGLLIQSLSVGTAVLSIILGYVVLALVFVFYGGLGYKKRMLSSEILQEVFGDGFSKYIIPTMLDVGQLGWAAINMTLGGTSLAVLAHIPVWLGIVIYAIALGTMTSMNFLRLAFMKAFIVVSSLSLIGYAVVAKLLSISYLDFLAYRPAEPHSLFWGVSIVVASYIAFATVTPNFLRDAKDESDVLKSTLVGFVAPGMLMIFFGCFLFFDQSGYNLNALLAALVFPLLPIVLNVIANTDGSISLYTPALSIVSRMHVRFVSAAAIAACISCTLALLHIADHLAGWLSVLSLMAPALIGVTFAAVFFNEISTEAFRALARRATLWIYGITVAACLGFVTIGPSVLFALVAPLILYTGYMQYWVMSKA